MRNIFFFCGIICIFVSIYINFIICSNERIKLTKMKSVSLSSLYNNTYIYSHKVPTNCRENYAYHGSRMKKDYPDCNMYLDTTSYSNCVDHKGYGIDYDGFYYGFCDIRTVHKKEIVNTYGFKIIMTIKNIEWSAIIYSLKKQKTCYYYLEDTDDNNGKIKCEEWINQEISREKSQKIYYNPIEIEELMIKKISRGTNEEDYISGINIYAEENIEIYNEEEYNLKHPISWFDKICSVF